MNVFNKEASRLFLVQHQPGGCGPTLFSFCIMKDLNLPAQETPRGTSALKMMTGTRLGERPQLPQSPGEKTLWD